ncbi:hypothetical protein LCGC14_1668510 [marine sediment metagenome]|uniref:Uncharacterized protein n=1 Tax=marine sediment metagenome TaxID=412755 RepID=A0A0F9HSU8_9ZZZZ
MPEVKFADVKIGQVYVTHGGTVVVDKSSKAVGWGYDRVRVIKKNSLKLVVETPWGTSCILTDDYPLYMTREVEPRIEFKLITNYIFKQELSFDDAIAQGICIENIPPEALAAEKFLEDLIEYFALPQSISSAAQKFSETYQKIRYSVDKIENIGKFRVYRRDMPEGKTVHITEVK